MSDLLSQLSDIARRLPSRTGQRWVTMLAGRPSFAELEEAVHRLMGLGGREPLERELQARADHDGAEQRPERRPNCGARWTEDGARKLLALRTCSRNGDWEQLYPNSTLRFPLPRKAA